MIQDTMILVHGIIVQVSMTTVQVEINLRQHKDTST